MIKALLSVNIRARRLRIRHHSFLLPISNKIVKLNMDITAGKPKFEQ